MVVMDDGLWTRALESRLNDAREPGETYEGYDVADSEELADDPLA